jgi:hypothetical protein
MPRWSRDEDLYTLIVERSKMILSPEGGFGMILPLSIAFSTKTPFGVLREVVGEWTGYWHWSHFDRIPSALFGNEVRTRCSIGLWHSCGGTAEKGTRFFTTSLIRWNQDARPFLFERLCYSGVVGIPIAEGFPKVGSEQQAAALRVLVEHGRRLREDLVDPVSFAELAASVPQFPKTAVFVGGTAYNWFPAWREIPETTNADGEPSLPARTAGFRFRSQQEADAVFALLCSSLGYWWWIVASDGFNLKRWLIERFPLSLRSFNQNRLNALATLGVRLAKALRKNYVFKDNEGRIGNFYLPACAAEVHLIDEFLAGAQLGLSAEMLEDIRGFNQSFSTAELSDETDDD